MYRDLLLRVVRRRHSIDTDTLACINALFLHTYIKVHLQQWGSHTLDQRHRGMDIEYEKYMKYKEGV